MDFSLSAACHFFSRAATGLGTNGSHLPFWSISSRNFVPEIFSLARRAAAVFIKRGADFATVVGVNSAKTGLMIL